MAPENTSPVPNPEEVAAQQRMAEAASMPEPQTPETDTTPETPLLNEIRQERVEAKYQETVEFAAREIRSTELNVDQSLFGYAQDAANAAERGTSWYDSNLASPNTRSLFDAMGSGLDLPKGELLKKVTSMKMGEDQAYPIGQGLTLKVSMFGEGRITHRIEPDSAVATSDREAALSSFANKAKESRQGFDESLEGVAARLEAGEMAAHSSTAYNFESNRDDLLTLMTMTTVSKSLRSSSSAAKQLHGTIEEIYALPSHYPGETPDPNARQEGIYFDEDGKVIKALLPTRNPGLYVSLKSANEDQRGDLSDIDLLPGIELNVPEMYAELTYDGDRMEGAEPFVETTAAAEILDTFEQSGLIPASRIKNSFAEVGEIRKRYGHGYADLTREIAKLVNDRDRPIDRFFKTDNPSDTLERMGSLGAEGHSASADMALGLLRGVARRDATASEQVPEIPLSLNRVDLSDGSCKDIEVYIADKPNDVIQGDDGKPLMLRSGYKLPTFTTLKETVFNGVRLPAGSLLLQQDDGYLFMRITSFAVSPEEAAQTFGAQDAENRASPQFDGGAKIVRSRLAA